MALENNSGDCDCQDVISKLFLFLCILIHLYPNTHAMLCTARSLLLRCLSGCLSITRWYCV